MAKQPSEITLTKEQTDQMEVYRNKWIKIGLCTDPADWSVVDADIRRFASLVLNRDHVIVVHADGPIDGWIRTCILQAVTEISSKVKFEMGDGEKAKVSADRIAKNIASLKKQISHSTDESKKQYLDILDGEIVKNCVSSSVVWPYTDGQFGAGYVAFYEFMREVVGIKYDVLDKWLSLVKLTGCGPIWFLEKFVIAMDRPKTVFVKEGRLHKEGAPAMSYGDGAEIHSLNGIRCKKWMAEEDPTTWDAEKVLGVDSVDQRREVVRRYGIDRLWDKASVIDVDGSYQVGIIEITGSKRVYLRMVNPSIGCFHVESVGPECKTVQQALNWRNGLNESNIDDVNGADWYQHGDVIIRPEGAEKFKSNPKILS